MERVLVLCVCVCRASGASSAAYWIANFVFDFTLMFLLVLMFGIVFAIFVPASYTGAGFGAVVGAGFFYIIAAIFRFYSFSYFIEDVRLAQSIYFYGSLCMVFVLIDIWFNVLFISANANAGDPAIVTLGMIFTVLDPTFGFYIIVLYANNFLGMLTQSGGDDTIAGPGAPYFSMLILAAALYGAVFVLFSEGALSSCCAAMTRCFFCGTGRLKAGGGAMKAATGGTKSPMIATSESVSAVSRMRGVGLSFDRRNPLRQRHCC